MIEYIKKCFKGISSALDVIDIIAVCAVATIIFLSVPFYFIKKYYENGNIIISVIIVVAAAFAFTICLRDFKKKKWSIVSISTLAIWVICALIAGIMFMS